MEWFLQHSLNLLKGYCASRYEIKFIMETYRITWDKGESNKLGNSNRWLGGWLNTFI